MYFHLLMCEFSMSVGVYFMFLSGISFTSFDVLMRMFLYLSVGVVYFILSSGIPVSSQLMMCYPVRATSNSCMIMFCSFYFVRRVGSIFFCVIQFCWLPSRFLLLQWSLCRVHCPCIVHFFIQYRTH